ncbi:hypothetical protein NQ318_018827 [Aromia moschata]|uniref:Uncharacterized protein n=1 Tax=Aromia moschata TaxID=1265417 RepID=A0AAV8ZHF3_9CUCU|nr:hypothetical protein NQ318_018827 [Aromia moschata]
MDPEVVTAPARQVILPQRRVRRVRAAAAAAAAAIAPSPPSARRVALQLTASLPPCRLASRRAAPQGPSRPPSAQPPAPCRARPARPRRPPRPPPPRPPPPTPPDREPLLAARCPPRPRRPVSYPCGPDSHVEAPPADGGAGRPLEKRNSDPLRAAPRTKLQVRPFTRESLEKLERKTLQLVREYGFQPRRKLSVEDGSRLPAKFEPFPSRLYGRPLEEIDNFIYDEVSASGSTLRRERYPPGIRVEEEVGQCATG